jgi:hypothetical protein
MTSDPRRPPVPVEVGDLISLAEPDQYGRGKITLRVTVVHAESLQWSHDEWVWLDGVEIRWDSTELPNRRVLARVTGIQRGPA